VASVQDGIVLELQSDCIDTNIPVRSILRKTKLIASKLDLDSLQEWIESELSGYECSLQDLPDYRKGVGQPKFKNPYHGWCPIMTDTGLLGQTMRTVYFKQSVSELEELIQGGSGHLVMQYEPIIEQEIQKQLPARMECGLHFSSSQITTVLDFVRNKVLDWSIGLEKQGILGSGLTFNKKQKQEAESVTNNIYGGNVGVLGAVSGDMSGNSFTANTGDISITEISNLVSQIKEMIPVLPSEIADQIPPSLFQLEELVKTNSPDKGKIQNALTSLKAILEGASGNLAATGIISAIAALTP